MNIRKEDLFQLDNEDNKSMNSYKKIMDDDSLDNDKHVIKNKNTYNDQYNKDIYQEHESIKKIRNYFDSELFRQIDLKKNILLLISNISEQEEKEGGILIANNSRITKDQLHKALDNIEKYI